MTERINNKDQMFRATIERAQVIDSDLGNFRHAAEMYRFVWETADNVQIKLDAGIGLTQQLINMSSYGEARRVIESIEARTMQLTDVREVSYYTALCLSKVGWIYEMKGEHLLASYHFETVQNYLGGRKSFSKFDDKERALWATSVHFLGRADLGLGYKEDAIRHFEEHMSLPGLNPDEYGYDHVWFAKKDIESGELDEAKKHVELARQNFDEHLKAHPGRIDLLAQILSVEAYLAEGEGDFIKAKLKCQEAVAVYDHFEGETGEGYKRGKIRALIGATVASAQAHDWGSMIVYGSRAIPAAILFKLTSS